VNNEFYKWLEKTYGNPSVATVKAKRGKIHNYLAMKLDFTEDGKVKVDMKDYINSMIKEFPEELADSKYPWNENLFKQKEDDMKLSDAKRQIHHTFVAKCLFLSKRARPNIQTAIAYLTTQVKDPREQDWF
jgi:hypothetical protein